MSLLMRPLFSGSKGNAAYIEAGDVRLVVDAGVSATRLESALADMGCDCARLDGILVSHEHSDHISGLNIFAAKHGVRIYANAETWRELSPKLPRVPAALRVVVDSGSDFCIRGLNIETYDKPHDAVRSLGFGFYHNGLRAAVVTDLGYMPKTLLERLCGCQMLLLESNYDEQMLLYGSYPEYLKKRIHGRRGHLSNHACGEALCALVASGASQVALMHLSEENNTPERALGTVEHILLENNLRPGRDVRLLVATQTGPCDELQTSAI